MNIARHSNPKVRIAVIESDPLRFVGFRALLESESDLELIPASLPEIAIQTHIDVVLIGDRVGQNLFDTISNLKMMLPNLPISKSTVDFRSSAGMVPICSECDADRDVSRECKWLFRERRQR